MKSLELFVGAGGMALGISEAGFEHKAVIEWDADACATIRNNATLTDWSLFQQDARTFDYSHYSDGIDLVAGGPPCQPFSIGGKHRGFDDSRDMFPEMVRAVRETRPRVIFVENVKGLLRASFSEYFESIVLQLSYPELIRNTGESWTDHLSRLERHHTQGNHDGLHYNVVFRLVNAADYGVPQKRERVFIVGFRSDLGIQWSFPEPTHSVDGLLLSKWVTEEYWERHKVPRSQRSEVPSRLKERIDWMKYQPTLFTSKPWVTVRDAIADLPDPENVAKRRVPNHEFRPGARVYAGHTGSPMDEPAKTLKAGDHGVPGGENMLVRPDGSVRYFTVRESARLQTFPDAYVFHSSWTESMRQLGNAVPMRLAGIVAKSIRQALGS